MGAGLRKGRPWRLVLEVAVALVVLGVVAGVSSAGGNQNAYRVRTLVSDRTDANLVNAWGLAAGPTSPWWVADNGTDVSTLYDAAGAAMSLVVSVGGGPTGTVFNGTTSFVVSDGVNSGASLFLFASEDGKIRGWSPAVPPPAPSTVSEVAVDRSSQGAIYKGLAIASTEAGDFLYATDFHNGRVDVFDGSFGFVDTPGAFVDDKIPSGFAPFGIQNIGGTIFVTYAKQDADGEDDVQGKGLGFVDRFDTSGTFLGRVASRGQLNAPWGLAMAPGSFGKFGGDLLVGNFGDGRINAYRPNQSGKFGWRGALRNTHGKSIKISGLWALAFGNGAPANGPSDPLFFTAGPRDEKGGRFGTITVK